MSAAADFLNLALIVAFTADNDERQGRIGCIDS